MAFFSDTAETANRFGDYIEEFQQIFCANNVSFGSPDDFFAVARKLSSSTQLNSDLSRLVKFIIDKESGTVSLRTILTIIALASGGPHVADSGGTTSKPINLFIDFLIAVGGYTRIDSDQMDGMYPLTSEADGGPISQDRQNFSPETPHREALAEESEDVARTSEQPAAPKEFPANPQDSSTDSSTALNQSLTRLELNAFEVKLYLDSIDQRISRMEPRLEGLPSPAEHLPPLTVDPNQHAAPPAALYSRLDVPPQNSSAEQSAQQAERSSSPSRLSTFLPATRVLPVLMGAVALLAALLLYQNIRRNSTHHQVVPLAPVISTPAGPAPAAAVTVPDTSPPLSPTLPAEPARASTPTIEPQPRKRSAQIPFRTNPASTLPVVAKNTPAAGSSPATHGATPGAPNAAASLAPAVADSVPPLPRRIDVSSGVMAANLISAPPPSYPKLARLTHIRGQVVLQVAISSAGTVEDLRVIKGHRLLRGAAINAVRTWRYRPYLANGTATEVATIVSVEVVPGP